MSRVLPDERGRRNADGIRRSRERRVVRCRKVVKSWSRCRRRIVSNESADGRDLIEDCQRRARQVVRVSSECDDNDDDCKKLNMF